MRDGDDDAANATARVGGGKVLPALIVEPTSPSPSLQTVVFLHGWPDSPVLWQSQMNALSRLGGYRCVALPLSGYEATFPPSSGTSLSSLSSSSSSSAAAAAAAASSDATPTFDSAVNDVAASIRALQHSGNSDDDDNNNSGGGNNSGNGGGDGDKIRGGSGAPVVLVCHDWGCLVGYRLQRRFPELVARMAAGSI